MRNYAAVPFEYRREMAKLTDEEFGRLIRGLLAYGEEGTEIQAEGNEGFYVYRVCAQEDRFQESYEERAEQNRRNGRKGGRPKKGQDVLCAAEQPAAEQEPAGQDPAEQHAGERKPAGQKQAAPAEQESAGQKPAEQPAAEQPAAEQEPAGQDPAEQHAEKNKPQHAAQAADPEENPPVFSETGKTETETEIKTETKTETDTEIKSAAGGGAGARVCARSGEREFRNGAETGAGRGRQEMPEIRRPAPGNAGSDGSALPREHRYARKAEVCDAAVPGRSPEQQAGEAQGDPDGFERFWNACLRQEKQQAGEAQGDPDGFERFWNAYPRQVKKQAARRAWELLHPAPELTARILEALEQQRTWPLWQKEAGRYIPAPDRWLQDGRWEDADTGAAAAPGRPGTGPEANGRFGSHEFAAVQRLLRDHSVCPG